MGHYIFGDIGAVDGAVTGERQTWVCTHVVPGHCVMHPGLEGSSDLGKNRACVHGRVQDRVCLQEDKHVGEEESMHGTRHVGG